MTDDNSNLVDMDDLDKFSDAFYNREPVATDKPVEEKEDKEEEVLENEDDTLATEEDKEASEDEPTEDENSEEEEEAEEPKPDKKSKKSFQDRINELTAKARNEERRSAELERRLAELEARKPEENTKPEPKPLREQLPADAPNPDALDENDEPIYPLGEFDKQYIRDLTKFTIAEERKIAKETEEKARQQQEVEASQEELKSSWLEKVAAAEEDDLPDIREKLGSMEEAFEGVDPNYGEFLAATIMSCDFGPQIMYYLSQNIGEAQKIVASGPAAATLAIGRLDAKFIKPVQEEKRNTKKVSEAPKPPETTSRGSGSKFATAGDTDDLDAFEKEFYKRK